MKCILFILLLKSFVIQAQDLTIKHIKAYDFLKKQKTLTYLDSSTSKKENKLRFSKEIVPMKLGFCCSEQEWKSLTKELNASDSLVGFVDGEEIDKKYEFYPYISKDRKYRFSKKPRKFNHLVFFSKPVNNVLYAKIYPSDRKQKFLFLRGAYYYYEIIFIFYKDNNIKKTIVSKTQY